MNILQQQEALKDMSESQLIKEAKRPSGSVPSYMILSELNRRKDMRQRYQTNQGQPNATVAEELITQTEQGLGSMMPRQPQMRPQMPMQQSAIAQNQPMRMKEGGVTRMFDGGDISTLSDDQLREAIAAIQASGSISPVQTQNLLQLRDELDVREQQKNQNYLLQNIANPVAALYDTAIGLPAAVAQNTVEYIDSLMTGEEPEYVGSAPAQTALFGTEPSLDVDISGNPNLRGPDLRKAELAKKRLEAERARALAEGAAEGRVGSTDPTPRQTQAEAEEAIEQIIEADPSLAESDGPRMVDPFRPSDEKVAGISAPVLRTDVPAVFDDAGDETVPVPQEIVYDDAQDEVLPVTPEGGTGGTTQVAGGISSLPLPLLLEAARFGADIADRGTRGEDFLGSIAGAGKTSIDRGLKLIAEERKSQQARDLAKAKSIQDIRDFEIKERIKKALRDPETTSMSELNTLATFLQKQVEQNPDLTTLERDQYEAAIKDIERQMRTRAGVQRTAQNLAPDAEAELSARRGG